MEIDHVPVSDLCDEHQLSPTLFDQWQKPFFENGPAAFERKNAAPEGRLQRTIAPAVRPSGRDGELVLTAVAKSERAPMARFVANRCHARPQVSGWVGQPPCTT
jgi:hypothetical protein